MTPSPVRQCDIVGYRNQASCGFRSIIGSYVGEERCRGRSVERVHLLREGYDLDVCAEHLRLFPASALDLDVMRDGS